MVTWVITAVSEAAASEASSGGSGLQRAGPPTSSGRGSPRRVWRGRAVLVASGSALGLHDVGEARYRDLDVVDPKDPSTAPDPLEVEPGHDEREIDVEAGAVRGADERLVGDDAFREKAVPRSIERLGGAHEIETERVARAPDGERLVGIGRQKKVTIQGDEQRPGGPGVVVRAREPDDYEPNAVAAEPFDQARECVHQPQREARA